MNVNPQLMGQYVEFLEEYSKHILRLCDNMEELMVLAAQCMDQESGRNAGSQLYQNVQNIRSNVPIADDACKRLILALKRIADAENVFGKTR